MTFLPATTDLEPRVSFNHHCPRCGFEHHPKRVCPQCADVTGFDTEWEACYNGSIEDDVVAVEYTVNCRRRGRLPYEN